MTEASTQTPGTFTFKDVRAVFDKRAHGYDSGSAHARWIGPELVAKAILEHTSPASVLDVGVGTGLASNFIKISSPQTRVVGVDFSQPSLDLALQHKRIDEAVNADLTDKAWYQKEALPARAFEGVVSSGVIDFISGDAVEIFTREIVRVLKPGMPFAITFEPQGTLSPGSKSIQHDAHKLVQLFTQAGATIVDLKPIMNAYLRPGSDTSFVENALLIGQRALEN